MSDDGAKTRYPGYDVWRKCDSPSWDAITRAVLEARVDTPAQPRFFNPAQWAVLVALCDGVVAQPAGRTAVPVEALLDARLLATAGQGWHDARMPRWREAWRLGLIALDAESQAAHGLPFARLAPPERSALITRMQRGELRSEAWQGMPAALFFSQRVLRDLYSAYYSHPAAWSEIGFGGPANPRGYVRLYKNRRDPWEPVEATSPADTPAVARKNARVR